MNPAFLAEWNARMRAQKLTFGNRLHCPFLRPFFLTSAEERRVREVAETIALLGERVVKQALADPALLAQLALSEEEERLARIDPSYATSSTASRLDAFLLPDSLQFAEYNAESPAGPAYSETLADLFLTLPVMQEFEKQYRVRKYALMDELLDALVASYREWGGTASPPVIAIVDWREVPTWTEFEILQAHFEKRGVPTIVSDPRDVEFKGGRLRAQGRSIDLLYRRVLINDILARRAECDALVQAYASGAVCMANCVHLQDPAQESVLCGAHRRRQFSAFQSGRARGDSPPHSLDTAAGGCEDHARRPIVRTDGLCARSAQRFCAEAK